MEDIPKDEEQDFVQKIVDEIHYRYNKPVFAILVPIMKVFKKT